MNWNRSRRRTAVPKLWRRFSPRLARAASPRLARRWPTWKQAALRAFGFAEPGAKETLIPFLDQQPVSKAPALRWEQLKSWITPNKEVYRVQHYGVPEFDLDKWRLEFSGLVKKPRIFTLADIQA